MGEFSQNNFFDTYYRLVVKLEKLLIFAYFLTFLNESRNLISTHLLLFFAYFDFYTSFSDDFLADRHNDPKKSKNFKKKFQISVGLSALFEPEFSNLSSFLATYMIFS